MVHNEDLSGVYNNWGYYYHRKGDYQQAAASFEKAAELKPDRFAYYNNLGYAFYELGDRKASEQAFRKSLAIHGNQPDVEKFMKENILLGE
jgi:Flp pilus assembly protein TadD